MEKIEQISTSDEPNKVNKIRKSSDETLNNLFETGKWSDLTVTANSKDYLVHQNIICSAIPFFDVMMSGNFKESQENRVTISHPIDNEAFEWLIQWAYSFEKEINSENVRDLLAASIYFDVKKVFHACCVYLGEILNVKTALSIKEWISPFDVGKLNNQVTVYILENFKAISKTEKWLNLSIECLTKYIKDGDAVGFDEHEIVEAILGWAEFDPDSRKEHLSALLGLIIWHDIDLDYICEEITARELIKNNKTCVALLMNVLKFKAFPDPKHPMFRFWKRVRIHKYEGEAIMTFVKPSNNLLCYVKTPFSRKWKLWKIFYNSEIELSERLQITETGKFLCFHSEKDGSSSEIFVNLSTKACKKGRPTFTENDRPSLDEIYVSEDLYNSTGIIKLISVEDLKSSVWCDLFSSYRDLIDFGVAHLNDSLYFIGGSLENSESASAVNKRYNILESKWDILPPMSTPRFNPEVVTLNDKIYVYGGSKSKHGYRSRIMLKSIECYDPIQQKWFDVPTPESDIDFLVPFSSNLYAFSDEKLENLNIYDPKTNKWTICKRPGFTRDNIAVIFVPNLQVL